MARIDQFLIGRDRYDLDRLRQNLREKLINDHTGREQGVKFEELVNYYFDTRPARYEDKALIEQIYQDVRLFLEGYGVLLDVEKRHRFVVQTTEEAEMALIRKAKWWPRLQVRLLRRAGIAVDIYKLSPGHVVVEAIHSATASAETMSKAIEEAERRKLPPGEGNPEDSE